MLRPGRHGAGTLSCNLGWLQGARRAAWPGSLVTRNWIEIWAARSEELRSDDVRILTRLTSGPRLAPQASVIQRPEQF